MDGFDSPLFVGSGAHQRGQDVCIEVDGRRFAEDGVVIWLAVPRLHLEAIFSDFWMCGLGLYIIYIYIYMYFVILFSLFIIYEALFSGV